MARISIIAALGYDRALGKDNQLLWRIPDDLKRFKALTLGHPVVMGRKTFDSIGKALPGRPNLVATHDKAWCAEGASVFHSLEDALNAACKLDSEEVFVIGGAQIYAQALPVANRLYLTLIAEEKEADAFFPPYEHLFTKMLSEEERCWNGLKYQWIGLER
jgi:dihydrofolate reductase